MENFDYLKIELKDIVSATGNFDRDKVIGGGGFGLVYKGELSLPEGLTTAAFKRLDAQWGQGNTEFRKEIMMLSEYRHENLISLMYFCDEGDEMILVYEYASRGSLDNYLSDESLTWTNRLNICIGIARALDYLHDPMGTQKRVLHRDIKSSNVLLDDNWTVKVSDFGLSRIGPANQQQSYLISRAVGTPGYCDPMYWQMGFLTKESDVYSFGVVLFEVMCGKLCVQYAEDKPDEPNLIVHEWLKCYEEDRLDEIVFHPLKEQMEPGSLSTFSSIAYKCLKIERKDRPSMAKIVQRLEFALEQQEYEGGGGADATITTTTGKGQVEVAGEAKGKLVHFGGTRGFTDDDLLYATAEMMGKGTYGGVYKATLEYGDQIAVKRLKEMITKNQREFEIEVNLLGKIRHSNLLTMRAYYLGPKEEKLLIFDFMPNGNLTTFLHARGPETPVDWPTRMRIAKALARGLLSLHTHHNMIHGNLTSRNVLLDEDINPKIADFGLSRLMTAKTNSIRIVTPGALPYRAPELLTLKKANTKTDIYSLGVIMLELLTGKSPGEAINGVALPQWVASIVKEEWTNEVFDLDLLKDASENGDELLNTLKLALICVDPSPSARPEAQLVLQQLKEIRPETTTSSGDDGGVGPSTSE